MDTVDLDTAHLQLLATAEAITAGSLLSPHTRSTVDRILGWVAARDRELAGAGRDLLTGYPVEVAASSAADMMLPAMDGLSHAQLLHLVRANAVDLIAVVRTIPEDCAGTPVRPRPVAGSGHARKSAGPPLTWNEVVDTHASTDLPAHIDRLATFAFHR